jgi:hypothetical protein
MKNSQIAGLVLVVAVVLLVTVAGISRGQELPAVFDLYCNDTRVAPLRAEIEINDWSRPPTSTTTGTATPALTHIRLFRSFQKATRAGNVEKPAPGQCTWLDRPVNPDEPSALGFRSRDAGPVSATFTFENGALKLSSTNLVEPGPTSTWVKYRVYGAGGVFWVSNR